MFLKSRINKLFSQNGLLGAIQRQCFGRNLKPVKVNFEQSETIQNQTENRSIETSKKLENSQKLPNLERNSKKQIGTKIENYGPYSHLGFETNVDELEVESHYQKKVLVKRENGNDHFYGKKTENNKKYEQKIDYSKNEGFERTKNEPKFEPTTVGHLVVAMHNPIVAA